MSGSITRVLVVDDALSYRHVLSKVLASLPQVEVVGVASTIASAKARLQQGGVDFVTLDVNLNQESGLELLEWIRRTHPAVISVLVTAGEASGARTEVDALLLGAAALIIKPAGTDAPEVLRGRLHRVLTATATAARGAPASAGSASHLAVVAPAPRELIAVGASTGGPPVLEEFLSGFPRTFEVPIVIVQHMPAPHVPYFAELLVARSGRPGKVADDGEPLKPGHFYIAGHAKHLVVRRRSEGLWLYHDSGPEEHFCRPAVDPFFRSVAEACGRKAVGVVMTGMGLDGGAGAQVLRETGAPIAVQDEATSVVWSMPRAVVSRGAACAIAPRSALSKVVLGWTTPSPRTSPHV